ncbi:MAG: acetate--CoA ligase family protein [Anaerolineales bacterium]|nr:acetate--CoA ligase family protein [Anaerolineales bacterium]
MLKPFFSPQGVAVIGASQDPTKLGYGLARNIVQSNYHGAVHFVNPKEGRLLGQTIYPSILQVPDPVDLAIILIPAPGIPQALRECAQRGITAAIIASGGFRETGEEGARREAEIVQIAQQHQMRLLGPNCIGLLDTHLPIDATFLPPPGPLPGDVAFVSHSGAICAAVIDWARGQGFGLSRLVSLGNQADITETELLMPMAADPYTKVITLYLEGISNGRKFIEQAQQVTPRKPIIALKVGRYAAGQRAAASHTGALAGQENAFNAAFRRAGVIRADTSEELFDWARALAWCPPPKGRAIAVLTNAGGPGVTAADALEANGMQLAELQPTTRTSLASHLPHAASLHNPIDMLASATPEQYAACLEILLNDEGVAGVLVIFPPPPMYTAGAVAKAIIPIIHNAEKPVTVALMGEKLIQEAVEHFRAAHVVEYRFPERAASALAILAQRAEFLARANAQAFPPISCNKETVQSILQTVLPGFLDGEKTNRILQAYGIPVTAERLAQNAQQAVEFALEYGVPVALKVSSPDVVHKSDVGGVLLNLENAEAVKNGYDTVLSNILKAHPTAKIRGVTVQPMLSTGQEVILGVVQDAQFGPLVMFGSGGVEVEGLKDVSFALAPLTPPEAEFMLSTTWAGKKLNGFRGQPPADRQALLDVMVRLAQLASDFPDITEVEINPLRVLPAGQGAFALDARMRFSG